MTKTLFICFFYSSLVPYAYFFACGALFMNYWCDKYMLLRRWQYAPKVRCGAAGGQGGRGFNPTTTQARSRT